MQKTKTTIISLTAVLATAMLAGCSMQSATQPAASQQPSAQSAGTAAPATAPSAGQAEPSATDGKTAAADKTEAACREHPLEGLPGANKLELKEACTSFSGVVETSSKQKDGSLHLTVMPDKEFMKLVNEKNNKTAGGRLPVIVTAADAKTLSLPKNGTHVHVTGSYVIEMNSGLAEVLPAWVLEPQSTDGKTGDGTAESASKPSADATQNKPSSTSEPAKSAAAVRIIDITTPAHRGEQVTVKAKVAPGSTASIVVHYKSGQATAAGLEPKKADSNGNVSWTWTITDNIAAGKWPVTVTTKSGGASAGIQIEP